MRRLELAERVIELRESADLTQEEAAKKAGVGVTTWSNIETGTIIRPHARTVIKMARALGVDPEELTDPKAGALPSSEPERVSEEERRYLSALLDPYTKRLRHLSGEYGPHLRLLPPDPSPDSLSQFSWITRFLQICLHMDHMVNDPAFSAVVDPWLSRMNDEAVPAGIRQKLRDFDAAWTELFDEIEPVAEEWLAAQRSASRTSG